MFSISDLRIKYGPVYLTEFETGLLVPWKPLSIGEWIEYEEQIRAGIYPRALLENEIFTKCVLDPYLVKNIDKQNAGIVTVVVDDILFNSGPSSLEEFNQGLNFARLLVQEPLHQMVKYVCIVFSAWTPDEVYAMPFPKLLQMYALAEHELLRTNLLPEPITLEHKDSQPKTERKRAKIDPDKLKEAFDIQSGSNKLQYDQASKKAIRDTEMEQVDIGSTKEGKDFLIPKAVTDRPFVFGKDAEDAPLFLHQLEKDAQIIYGDYIAKMKKGEKITPETIKNKVYDKVSKSKK